MSTDFPIIIGKAQPYWVHLLSLVVLQENFWGPENWDTEITSEKWAKLFRFHFFFNLKQYLHLWKEEIKKKEKTWKEIDEKLCKLDQLNGWHHHEILDWFRYELHDKREKITQKDFPRSERFLYFDYQLSINRSPDNKECRYSVSIVKLPLRNSTLFHRYYDVDFYDHMFDCENY